MSNLNKVMFIGNLGADPQLFNNDANKSAMVIGRLAMDETWNKRDANGNVILDPATNKPQVEKITTWVSFQIYGKRAEAFAKFHKQGDQVYLEGQLRMGKPFLSKKPQPIYLADGNPQADAQGGHFHGHTVRSELFLRVEDWKFMKSKRDDNTAYTQPVAGAPVAGAAPAPGPAAVVPNAPAPQVQPNAQTVATAFNAQPEASTGPQDASAPQFAMPGTTIPQGV